MLLSYIDRSLGIMDLNKGSKQLFMDLDFNTNILHR